MSQLSLAPADDAPRLTRAAAVQYFVDGIKPVGQGRIGVEIELFVVDGSSLQMARFPQIEELLRAWAQAAQWQPITEGPHVIALARDGAMIALEPGGQLEIATPPLADVHAVAQTCADYLAELRPLLQARGLNLLSFGIHPLQDFHQLPIIPKARYGIMAPRLESRGTMAHIMMRGTCAWQCALDYFSEPDFSEKFRTAYHITTLLSALYANAAWEQGDRHGLRSRRLLTWLHTDPDRCGLIAAAYGGQFGFEDYFHYASQIPMLFINRAQQWIAVEDCTFAEFLRKGYRGHYATQEDWLLHLTTIFPEIRLKNFIELRGADANRPAWLASYPACFVGIFQDAALMAAARDLTRSLSFAERLDLHVAVAREGLDARRGRVPVYELVRELVAMARAGLEQRGQGEVVHLDPVTQYLTNYRPGQQAADIERIDAQHLAPYLLL